MNLPPRAPTLDCRLAWRSDLCCDVCWTHAALGFLQLLYLLTVVSTVCRLLCVHMSVRVSWRVRLSL